jgi:hypothetical protein
MKRASFLIAGLIVLGMVSPATTQPPAGAAGALQKLADDLRAPQNIAIRCGKGEYWCPGNPKSSSKKGPGIGGCCPNGWGCGPYKCIPPPTVRYRNCYWDGTGPFCEGVCRGGDWVERKRSSRGCLTGHRAYCCEAIGSRSTP